MNDVILLFWLHFIGDFLLQSDYMALNKSKSVKALSFHCLAYSLPFLWFGWVYALWACILHFPIDYISSKVTSYFWKMKQRHWFFVTIGFDQAVHMTILLYIMKYILV